MGPEYTRALVLYLWGLITFFLETVSHSFYYKSEIQIDIHVLYLLAYITGQFGPNPPSVSEFMMKFIVPELEEHEDDEEEDG